jgi:hypothetical protein
MWTRWCITVMAAALTSADASLAFARGSQVAHDDPWNPEHLERLLPEVRHALSRMCGELPRAGHYFATYFEDSRLMRLHFEHLHCDEGRNFCRQNGCLHQEYVFVGGRYRLIRTYYAGRYD